jgi:succinate dehydrogenase hydrophobic anchor subunit
MRDQRLWTWHLIAGVTILVFLGLHMGVMHLNTMLGLFSAVPDKAPIDWGNVIARSQSAFFAVTYVVLLGAALFHGLYGLRTRARYGTAEGDQRGAPAPWRLPLRVRRVGGVGGADHSRVQCPLPIGSEEYDGDQHRF